MRQTKHFTDQTEQNDEHMNQKHIIHTILYRYLHPEGNLYCVRNIKENRNSSMSKENVNTFQANFHQFAARIAKNYLIYRSNNITEKA